MSGTMRAAYYDAFGEARDVLRIGDVPIPDPAPGEVRVRLKTSGVNPSDFKVRRGAARGGVFPRTIPHNDGAGIIDAVGDESLEHRLGERVWTWSAQYRRPFGTAAQYVALPSARAPSSWPPRARTRSCRWRPAPAPTRRSITNEKMSRSA
jgi:NADPH2:quinone reductase